MTSEQFYPASSVSHSPLLDIRQANIPSASDALEQPPLEEIRQRIAEALTADVDLARVERLHIEAAPILAWRISVDIYPRI